MLRMFAQMFLGFLGLVFGAASCGLIYVGQRAHWTSDGPGMLLIMIGIVVFAGLSLACFAAAAALTPSSV